MENSVTAFAYNHKGKDDVDSIMIEDPDIHTNNEVESLANAVVKMSQDMRNYVESVIAAESKARVLDEMANKDALTSVRNKNAYDSYVLNLNKEIAEGKAKFALAMVDLNHLKLINDNYGHERGNEYIKKSCSVICHVFAHSPVFRVGGDEFVVVLNGDDFENRQKLLAEAECVFKNTSQNEQVDPWQRLSAAIGVSDFNPKTDRSVDDVFKRADKNMYDNKVAMKAERKN